jgi:hypothetical protein
VEEWLWRVLVTIQLSPEQERVVDQAIHAGLIRFPEDVVKVGVETIRQRLESRESCISLTNNEEIGSDWSRQLHEWIHSHPTDTAPLPDEALGRDSIYQGRGF